MTDVSPELQTLIEAAKRRPPAERTGPLQNDRAFCGDRLRHIRKEYGLNQEDVANLLGLTRTQVTNLETGRTDASLRVVYDLAYHFGVSADWLLGLSEMQGRAALEESHD